MNVRITDLPVMSTLENDDVLEVVDKSDLSSSTSGTNKQVTIVEIEDKLSNDGFTKTDEVLTKTNITAYTPTSLYHPSTKEYVDIKTLLLSGVNDMDPGYTPINPLSIVTKEYIDNTVSFIPTTSFITSSQTLVKPTGASYVHIKLYGAGGGGGGASHSSGGLAGNGGNGGDTTVTHLTRTFIANGGNGGVYGGQGVGGEGGAGGADIPTQRICFPGYTGTTVTGLTGGNGADGEYMITGNALGGIGFPGYSSDSLPGTGLGAGGGGGGTSNRRGGGGGGSGAVTEIILTAEDIDIIVGASGTAGLGAGGVVYPASTAGGQGSDGLAVITWY